MPAAFILLTTALIVGRFAIAICVLGDTVDEIAADLSERAPARGLALGPGRAADQIRLAILAAGAKPGANRYTARQTRLAAAEAIIAAVPDPLILLDQRRRIVRANAAAADFVGPPSPPRDLATALRNPTLLAAADAVLRGEASRVVEFTLTIPVERQLRARFARINQPSSDGAVAVLSLHDVTELKRAEQMRADFIANASHELRTPLATLAGFIETLRGPARDDAEARERFLAIMSGQAARMARLVEDLLSLSRIELNEHVPPQGRIALGAGARSSRSSARAARRRARHADPAGSAIGSPRCAGRPRRACPAVPEPSRQRDQIRPRRERDHGRRRDRDCALRRMASALRSPMSRSPCAIAARASRASICRA